MRIITHTGNAFFSLLNNINVSILWNTFRLTWHATATVLMLVRPTKSTVDSLKKTNVPFYSDFLKEFIMKSTDKTQFIFAFDLQVQK